VTHTTSAVPSTGPGLRPLTAIVGRGSETGRLLGHLDARRSVRLEAPRGGGATALLRALCGEPPRPAAPDGTVALPTGLPVVDMASAAALLLPASDVPVEQRRLMVLLDDRDATPEDITRLRETFAASLLVVTGLPESDGPDLAPVAVRGLSQHHAVGLVEAAMGRALTIEEGRAARAVATAVDGLPGPLVQAAAAVRDGGLGFTDVLDLLDDPPRPTALSVALQRALDDSLHVTLSHLRSFGDVPVTTTVLAAAAGLDRNEAARRMRRLSMLGLVLTDGRDGWTAASGVPPVSDPVRAGACERLTSWLAATDTTLDVFDTVGVLGAVADRVDAGDRATTVGLTQAALARLPADGLGATRALLESAAAWSLPEPELPAAVPPEVGGTGPGTVDDDDRGDTAAATDGGGGDATDDGVAATAATVGPASEGVGGGSVDEAVDEGEADQAGGGAGPAQPPSGVEQSSLLAFVSDRRRLALVAVVAAAVLAAMLLVVPSLRDDEEPAVLRGDVDLGVASIGESASGTLGFDLTGSTARVPVDLLLDGPDADAFSIDPARCDSLDCRAAVTFTPDRSGTHVATVRAVDASGAERAVASLSASGTGDAPDEPPQTNLAVTLFTTDPSPIPAGGDAVLPVGVTNNGPDDSSGAVLVLSLPERVSGSADGCTFADSQLRCPLAELPAGQRERIEVTVSVPRRIDQVRVTAQVDPVTDVDDATSDNAAGFTYPVAAPEQ